MRTHFITLAALMIFTGNALAKRKPFFDNDVIKMIDGMKIGTASFGIGGQDIHDMLWLVNEIRFIQNGHVDRTTKNITKPFLFKGELHTIVELAALEERLISSRTPDNAPEVDHLLAELTEPLTEAKKRFTKKTTMFIQTMRIMKSFVVQLIEEWCEKHERLDSILLDWAELDQNEMEHFDEIVTNNRELNQFLSDLRTFLMDLANSCPKALREFLDNRDVYQGHETSNK